MWFFVCSSELRRRIDPTAFASADQAPTTLDAPVLARPTRDLAQHALLAVRTADTRARASEPTLKAGCWLSSSAPMIHVERFILRCSVPGVDTFVSAIPARSGGPTIQTYANEPFPSDIRGRPQIEVLVRPRQMSPSTLCVDILSMNACIQVRHLSLFPAFLCSLTNIRQ
jgi:hypothetical protein